MGTRSGQINNPGPAITLRQGQPLTHGNQARARDTRTRDPRDGHASRPAAASAARTGALGGRAAWPGASGCAAGPGTWGGAVRTGASGSAAGAGAGGGGAAWPCAALAPCREDVVQGSGGEHAPAPGQQAVGPGRGQRLDSMLGQRSEAIFELHCQQMRQAVPATFFLPGLQAFLATGVEVTAESGAHRTVSLEIHEFLHGLTGHAVEVGQYQVSVQGGVLAVERGTGHERGRGDPGAVFGAGVATADSTASSGRARAASISTILGMISGPSTRGGITLPRVSSSMGCPHQRAIAGVRATTTRVTGQAAPTWARAEVTGQQCPARRTLRTRAGHRRNDR